jgi:hypothetical protein
MTLEKLVKLQSDVEAMLARRFRSNATPSSRSFLSLAATRVRKQRTAVERRLLPSIAIPKPERPGQDAD